VAFDSIQRSNRHASGYALRFPRIVNIRDDKPVEEIDTLQRVDQLYERYFGGKSEADLSQVAQVDAPSPAAVPPARKRGGPNGRGG
jgi:hypothetical protein